MDNNTLSLLLNSACEVLQSGLNAAPTTARAMIQDTFAAGGFAELRVSVQEGRPLVVVGVVNPTGQFTPVSHMQPS